MMDWCKIGKGVHQGCILSPCLFNLYAECTMQNTLQDKSQAAIKNPGRNINNLQYADDTTLMAESKEILNSLLTRVKEEREEGGLKLNIGKMKIMASSPITLWQIDGEKWKLIYFIFLSFEITPDSDCNHVIKRSLFLWRKVMANINNKLKSRDITLPKKVHKVKAMFFQ